MVHRLALAISVTANANLDNGKMHGNNFGLFVWSMEHGMIGKGLIC